ncbi:hypothetical protein FACS1894125_0670 [Actinomycetota bacterium]|nr:hypothetical protein FACS1894125_0670 [Actinomycetota bacterium]
MEITTAIYSKITPTSIETPLLVLLHGWGSNETDLPGLAQALGLGLDFVSLRAPFSLSVGGFAWFLDPVVERSKRDNQAKLSGDVILNWLEGEIAAGKIAKDRKLILLGFSQGGAMVSHLLTRSELAGKLAGVIMLSGYLPFDSDEVKSENSDVPVFHGWGNLDTLVEPEESTRAAKWFKNNCQTIVDKNYPIEHSICLDEAQDIAGFVNSSVL